MVMVRRNLLCVSDPHPHSLAALLLLNKHLSDQQLAEWFEFRDAYLERQIDIYGDLVCAYCGKQGLKKEVGYGEGHCHLATLDHIQAISRGGAQYDENNICVACSPCNIGKKDLPVDEWLLRNMH